MAATDTVVDSAVQARAWRIEQLVLAGYPTWAAQEIASADVDLHQAVDLLKHQGCSLSLALRILL
jgi:hypothetical protein